MIDQIVIGGYLLLTLSIGLYFKGQDSSLQKFLLSADEVKNNKFILMATIFATAVGAGTIFGLTSKIFLGDISYAIGLIIAITSDILVAFFLIPKIVNYQSYLSIGNIVEKYYQKEGKILYGIAVILVSLGYLSAQIKVSSHIFGYFTGISNLSGVILSYIIVIAYTTIGGLRSVILTDVLQFIFMILSIPYIAFCCLNSDGSWLKISSLASEYLSNANIVRDSLALSLSFAIMSINPPYLHRILISGKAKHAQSSSYIKSIIYLLFILMIVIIGLYSKINFTDNQDHEILTNIIDQIIPTGLKGLVFCGILGALMSTADSNLHIASLSFIYDIVAPIFKVKDNYIVILSRIFMIVFGLGAILIALNFDNVIDIVIFMSGFWGAMMFAPLIFLFNSNHIKKSQFIFAIVCGVFSFLYSEIYYPTSIVKPVFIGASMNFIIFSFFILLQKITNYMKKLLT